MKFSADLAAFLATEVNLDQRRLDLLTDRVERVEEALAGTTVFGDMLLDAIRAGSWAHRTIIRPVNSDYGFDADVLLLLEPQKTWQPKDYIEQLYSTLRGIDEYEDRAHRKTRCVRIEYAPDFHIDVVPYLDLGEQTFITNRATPEDTGRLEPSNPERFTEWLDERQRVTNGNFVKVVRLLKYLRDFKGTFSCKSIILATLLGERVDIVGDAVGGDLQADVPTALARLLRRLADYLPVAYPEILDPAGTGEDFAARYEDTWNYDNFRSCIRRYADQLDAALAETDRNESLKLWRSVLGESFGSELVQKAATPSQFSASERYSGESFIDQEPFSKPVHLNKAYRARITCRVLGYSDGRAPMLRRGFRAFELAKSGNQVRKNRSLKFIATTNVPSPYELYWKVRNGGPEAANVSQLRGEIKMDHGDHAKIERTSYKGRHYVECYIVKDGAVVATDRQDVIVP